MRRIIRKIIGGVLIACSLALLYMAGQRFLEYQHEKEDYDKIASDYTQPAPDTPDTLDTLEGQEKLLGKDTPVDSLIVDYDKLKAENPDYVGWIHMATGASYPIVRGKDNDEYLHHNFHKSYTYGGSLFMHYQNSMDFSDKNTFIYGHNMRNGSMFGLNRRYKEQTYAEQHPYFYIHVKGGYYTYQIFDNLAVQDKTETYDISMQTDEELQNYLNQEQKIASYWLKWVPVSGTDRIVSLSTCSGKAGGVKREVIQGKLLCYTSYDTGEQIPADQISFPQSQAGTEGTEGAN